MVTDQVSITESKHCAATTSQEHGFFENLYLGFVQVGIEDSINAVVQTLDHLGCDLPQVDIVDEPDKDSFGGTCGELLGLAGKIVGVGAAVGISGVAAPIALGVGTGALFALLTPEKDDHNFWENKLKDVTINAATFGIMSGAAQALETIPGLSITGEHSLSDIIARRMVVAAGSGAVAGFGDAEMDSLLHKGELAEARDVAYSVAWRLLERWPGCLSLLAATVRSFAAVLSRLRNIWRRHVS